MRFLEKRRESGSAVGSRAAYQSETVNRSRTGKEAAAAVSPVATSQLGLELPYHLFQVRGLEIVDAMMQDESVGTFIEMKKGATLASKWDIEPGIADDKKAIEIADQQKYSFEQLRGSLREAMHDMLSAVEYGYSATNIVYEFYDDGPWRGKIGVKHLKTKSPHNIRFDTDPFLNLKPKGILHTPPHGDIEHLPTDAFAIYTYRRRFSNPYGYGDCLRAYDRWNSKHWVNKFWDIHLERTGTGSIVALYDAEMNPAADEHKVVENYILDKQVRSGIKLSKAWEIEHHETDGRASAMFGEAIDHRNISIARALFLPDQLGFSAKAGGSFALGKKHYDIFTWIITRIQNDLAESVMTEQVIRRNVDLNWGPQDFYPRFVFAPLTDEQKVAWLTNVFTALEKGAIVPDLEIENAIRRSLDFSEKEKEDEERAGGSAHLPEKEEEKEKEKEKEPEDDDEDNGAPFEHHVKSFLSAWRTHTKKNTDSIVAFVRDNDIFETRDFVTAAKAKMSRTSDQAKLATRYLLAMTYLGAITKQCGDGVLVTFDIERCPTDHMLHEFSRIGLKATEHIERAAEHAKRDAKFLTGIENERILALAREAIMLGVNEQDEGAFVENMQTLAESQYIKVRARDHFKKAFDRGARAATEVVPLMYESSQAKLKDIVSALKDHPRVIIVGGPRSGKSTVAVRAGERFNRDVMHADSLIDKLEWSELSQEVSTWFSNKGEWIIEGIASVRAIRKFFKKNPKAKLDAVIVYMNDAVQARNKGQDAMAKGVATVWDEIKETAKSQSDGVIDFTSGEIKEKQSA